MTELKANISNLNNSDIELASEVEIDLDDNQPFLDNTVPNEGSDPIHDFCCTVKCRMFLFMICTFIFGMTWLSESQFSQGILRQKYINETCGFSIFGNKVCVEPLKCRNEKCIYEEKPPILNCNQSNIDLFCPKQTPCPRCPRCPACQNLVSYFDYVEFIGYYLEPTSKERTQIIADIPYGGCKELCSRKSNCKAICYRGDWNVCHIRNTYTNTPRFNGTWSCATKQI